MEAPNQLFMIPKNELDELKIGQKKILEALMARKDAAITDQAEYLTSKEFMSRVKIARSKFDELIANGDIKTVRPKGGRKIYVPVTEVARYFEGE